MSSSSSSLREQTILELRSRMYGIRAQTRSADGPCPVPTGLSALDQLLPAGGIPQGAVVEWISPQAGQAAGSLALRASAGLLQRPGCLTVIDQGNEFHPACAEAQGIPLSRILLVRIPAVAAAKSRSYSTGHDHGTVQGQWLWALEQAAGSRGVRVVLAWLPRATTSVVRRLQLAVESSLVTVMLLRPAAALRQASFADLRLMTQRQVRPEGKIGEPDRVQVTLLRSRGGVHEQNSILLRQYADGRFAE